MARSIARFNNEILFEPLNPEKAPLCDGCKRITYVVHQAICCGAYFCEACKTSAKLSSYNPSCARCNRSLGEVNYDFNETQKRNQVKVYCRNKQAGCPYTDERGSMDAHLSSCSYEMIPCVHEKCKQKVFRKDLQRHHEICPDRVVQCQFCKDYLRAIHLDQYHLSNGCQDFPKDCPNECGEKVTDRELPKHKETCSNEPVKCLFTNYGCTEPVQRHRMNKHVLDFKHMELLLKEIESSHKTQQTMQQTIQSLQAEVQSLKNYMCNDMGRLQKTQKESQAAVTQNYKQLITKVNLMERDFKFHKEAFEKFKTEHKMAQDDISKHLVNQVNPITWDFQLFKEAFENFKDECKMIQDGIAQATTLPFRFIVNNTEELANREEGYLSPCFYTACRRHKLRLTVFPGGKGIAKGRSISVWLHRINYYGVQNNQLPERVKIQVFIELVSQLPMNEADNHVTCMDGIVHQDQQEEVIFKMDDFISLRDVDATERRKLLTTRHIQYRKENSLLFQVRSAMEATL